MRGSQGHAGMVPMSMRSDPMAAAVELIILLKSLCKRPQERNPSRDGLVYTAWKPWVAVGMRNGDYKQARHFEVDLSAFRNILDIDKKIIAQTSSIASKI